MRRAHALICDRNDADLVVIGAATSEPAPPFDLPGSAEGYSERPATI